MTDKVSVEQFEKLVQARQHEAAGSTLFQLLLAIDANAGALEKISCQTPAALNPAERELHICERISTATIRLFLDPDFGFSTEGFRNLMCLQRWFGLLLGCTQNRNADHAIRMLCNAPPDEKNFAIPDAVLLKCLFLMTIESELPLDLNQFWTNKQIEAGTLFLAWLSCNVMGSPAAHQKRELLLTWWPARMQEAREFRAWPLPIAHSAYMMCSYGFLDQRHQFKKALNALIRQDLIARGLGDVATVALKQMSATQSQALAKLASRLKAKPVLLVVTEWFSPGFAVYRTHSMTLRALRDKFHLVGVGPRSGANDEGQAVFHEFNETAGGDVFADVAQVRELADKLKPDIVYHLGVGMFPHTVFLSNIRLASIQMVSNGHGASTFSPQMDYFITDGGYISGQAAFGETILPMPPHVMQMIPNVDTPDELLKQVNRVPRREPVVVKIAIAAAVIKINPVFIDVLRIIAEQSQIYVEYHFPMAQAVGPIYHRTRAEIQAILGGRAFVYVHQRYPEYMQILSDCDLFLNPFPYGNTNGIADIALLGLPGICKAGPELAEHIDVGMFKNIGLPDWCVAWTHQAYVDAALRMIHNHEERYALSQQLIESKAYSKLSENQTPEVMGEILLKMCRG
jgi:hypothetical protein